MNLQVIINKCSKLARNERALATINKRLGPFLRGITESTCAQDAIDVARRAAKNNIDTLVVIGGDGTVNGILSELAGTGIALGVIPGGTANDLASLYDLPSDVAAACDVILRRQLRAVDLIGINGRYFVTGGGLGLPSKVAAKANWIKSRGRSGKLLHSMLGSKLYVVSAICALLGEQPGRAPLAIRGERDSLIADFLALMISNQPFAGKHFYISPSAANNDGQFDVCLIENSRCRVQTAEILLRVLRGSHTKLPSVTTWRARELTVHSERPLPFYADGEHLCSGREFTFNMFPKSLNLIVPAGETQLEIRVFRERNDHGLYN